MTVIKWDSRAGAYYDSVVLMQLQRALLGLPGVIDAGVVMATQANRDLLAANHRLPDSIAANPDDLLIAALNVGLESFCDSLIAQGAQAIHVEWRPPAGGNERLASLLAKMKK